MPCIFIIFLLFVSFVIQADDADRYQAAQFYKKKVQRALDKSDQRFKGECRLTLTMHHVDQRYATLKRIRTIGTHQVCKAATSEINRYKSKKIKYDIPEKILIIIVSTDN